MNFIHTAIEILCCRCGNGEEQHHDGKINKYLIPKKRIDTEFFNTYFDDVEHGFFHGFCCCFIAYIICGDKISERLFASLLLHDFLKCNGYEQDLHDKELVNFYDKLFPETYTHSNPEDDKNVIVMCDRLELRRYDDYKEWVDDRYYSAYNSLLKITQEQIDEFYNNIRPALLYFYKNRKDIFVRHGLEELDKADYSSSFPPSNSYMIVDTKKSYPIEIDRVPFGYISNDFRKQYGFCSNHGGKQPWNIVKGFIALDEFVKGGGKFIDSGVRDHLYALSEIDIRKWVFLYQSKVPESMKSQIMDIKSRGIPIISQELLFNFFTLVKIGQDRMFVLNIV